MKTRVLLAVTALVAFAVSAQAAVLNTKHDLSSGNAANSIHSSSQNQTCIFCHAPHNAQVNKLLWNRTATNVPATMYIYTSYNTGAMRAQLTQNTLGSDSTSLLCLSCHSLSTANIANVVTNAVGVQNPVTLSTNWTNKTGNMSDLRNDHPVGINYDAAQSVVGATSLVPSSVIGGQQVVGVAAIRLFKSAVSGTSSMECASCHSVHDNTNGKFLALSNTGSALCTTCHLK